MENRYRKYREALLARETPEGRIVRLEKQRLYSAKQRANLSEEERERRAEKARERSRKWYRSLSPERKLEVDIRRGHNSVLWRLERKKKALDVYGGVCNWCDEDRPDLLEVDHVNNDAPTDGRSSYQIYSAIVNAVVPSDDLQILCKYCNWLKREYVRLGLSNEEARMMFDDAIYPFDLRKVIYEVDRT